MNISARKTSTFSMSSPPQHLDFIGRETELNTLKELYKAPAHRGVMIRGRRRVGKTELIKHFIKDKPAIYCQMTESSVKYNMQCLLEAAKSGIPSIELGEYNSLAEVLRAIFSSAPKGLILVLDEYPSLKEVEPGLDSVLQQLVDTHPNVFLMLCGSNLDAMEELTRYENPLYGRLVPYVIQPLKLKDALHWLTSYQNPVDKYQVYALTDGLPGLLEYACGYSNFRDFIYGVFLSPTGYSQYFIEQALRVAGHHLVEYSEIIRLICSGKTTYAELATVATFDRNSLPTYINELLDFRIIAEDNSLFSKKVHKRYIIADTLLAFWFTFIAPVMKSVEKHIAVQYEDIFDNKLATFFGHYFELFCRDFLSSFSFGQLTFEQVGFWRQNVNGKQEELDVVAENKGTLVAGECKYTNLPFSAVQFRKLEYRANAVQGNFKNRILFIFSKSGIDSTVQSIISSREDVISLSLSDMIRLMVE